eukprot:scaffold4036_cov115-Isochrysis_galbana.AAC.2
MGEGKGSVRTAGGQRSPAIYQPLAASHAARQSARARGRRAACARAQWLAPLWLKLISALSHALMHGRAAPRDDKHTLHMQMN